MTKIISTITAHRLTLAMTGVLFGPFGFILQEFITDSNIEIAGSESLPLLFASFSGLFFLLSITGWICSLKTSLPDTK